MKRIITVFLLLVLGFSMLAAEDKVEGLWKSIDETGKTTAAWRIYQKDTMLYGEIVKVPDQADTKLADKCLPSYKGFPLSGDISKMTVVNTPFIYSLKMKNPGQWDSGNIIDPKEGKLYKCKITFRAADGKKYKNDMLEMRGEIGLGIGRSQLWERTNEAEIAALK